VCRGACRLMRQAGHSVLLEDAAARRPARRHLRRRRERRAHHRRGQVVGRGLAGRRESGPTISTGATSSTSPCRSISRSR
jgi:hypothetical protein